MLARLPSGEGVRVEGRKRRVRDSELLIERDLVILEKIFAGRTQAQVAKLLGITQQQVSNRLSLIHPSVKDGMKRLVERHASEGYIPDEAKAPYRAALRRAHENDRQMRRYKSMASGRV